MTRTRSFPCDRQHYDLIKKQYDAAVAEGLEEFTCRMPEGEWQVLVPYCRYLLEYMRNALEITGDEDEDEIPA